MNSKIYYTKPSVTELEVSYVTEAARNGWGERCYEYIDRFEGMFREHLGVKHAVTTSSATGALQLGLAALGIGPGDEVIMADINWIATAAPVVHLGAKPVFVDVLPDSWCIDPHLAEAAITPRTRAIVAVHLYGNICDMEKLLAISKSYGLPLLEDAAEAIGSVYRGMPAGSMGRFGAFSFHGTKTLTTGEGGMLVTDDEELYERILTLSNHGRARGETRQFWPDMVGYKYKMSNMQAALGCGQMERLPELVAAKRRVYLYYAQKLQGLPLKMNPEPEGTVNGYWMPTIVMDPQVPLSRDALLAAFKRENIDGRVFFWPLSMLPAFERKHENPVSYSLYQRAVNLPSYHDLSEADMDRVVAVIREGIEHAR